MRVFAAAVLGATMLPLVEEHSSAQVAEQFTSPKTAAPEYGHGLTAEEADSGWISLFDGQTTFGWKDARVDNGSARTSRYEHFSSSRSTLASRSTDRISPAGQSFLTRVFRRIDKPSGAS
ncbi:MAG: hypothetical protein HY000_10575 [Planctomycetes bacterium]|nr:hypothetical protein [Planctomycetota bacterium]